MNEVVEAKATSVREYLDRLVTTADSFATDRDEWRALAARRAGTIAKLRQEKAEFCERLENAERLVLQNADGYRKALDEVCNLRLQLTALQQAATKCERENEELTKKLHVANYYGDRDTEVNKLRRTIETLRDLRSMDQKRLAGYEELSSKQAFRINDLEDAMRSTMKFFKDKRVG